MKYTVMHESYSALCQPVDNTNVQPWMNTLVKICYCYYITKYLDLLDTVSDEHFFEFFSGVICIHEYSSGCTLHFTILHWNVFFLHIIFALSQLQTVLPMIVRNYNQTGFEKITFFGWLCLLVGRMRWVRVWLPCAR